MLPIDRKLFLAGWRASEPAEQLLQHQPVHMTSPTKGQNANYCNFTYHKCLKSFWWEVREALEAIGGFIAMEGFSRAVN